MNIHLILFNRGAGGNFLARVLTLDPATVCLGSKNLESAWDRCDYYCYPEQLQSPGAYHSNGLSAWTHNELNNFYFPFTRGMEQLVSLNKTVIEPIHPDHYDAKLQLLGTDDQAQLCYIEHRGCETWVQQQVGHKILKSSVHDVEQDQQNQTAKLCDILKLNADTYPIHLADIIQSESAFLSEYARACKHIGLQSYPELALKIYQTWRNTWAPV